MFNITGGVQTPRVSAAAASAIASGRRLSGIFRAWSGSRLTILSGLDITSEDGTPLPRDASVFVLVKVFVLSNFLVALFLCLVPASRFQGCAPGNLRCGRARGRIRGLPSTWGGL